MAKEIDQETGEVTYTDEEPAVIAKDLIEKADVATPAKPIKPYETTKHYGIKNEIRWQMEYIADTLGSPDDKARFSALSG